MCVLGMCVLGMCIGYVCRMVVFLCGCDSCVVCSNINYQLMQGNTPTHTPTHTYKHLVTHPQKHTLTHTPLHEAQSTSSMMLATHQVHHHHHCCWGGACPIAHPPPSHLCIVCFWCVSVFGVCVSCIMWCMCLFGALVCLVLVWSMQCDDIHSTQNNPPASLPKHTHPKHP